MELTQLKSLLEALVFAASDPLSPADLKKLVEGERAKEIGQVRSQDISPAQDPAQQLVAAKDQLEEEISVSDIKKCLGELAEECRSSTRGFVLVEVAKGYQFRTRPEHAVYIRQLQKNPKNRLSAPSMETLAILAYQQPMTRAKIEEIRGVDSGGVLKTLLDRDLARIVGRSSEAGRPILYGTSQTFLETFGLNSLSELPTLKDLETSFAPAPNDFISAEEELAAESLEEEVSPAVDEVDKESVLLVSELENSMRNLSDLEKKIFDQEEEKKLS